MTHRRRIWSGVLLALTLITLLAGCALPALPPLPWQQRQGPAPLPDAQQVLHVSAPRLLAPAFALDPIQQPGYGLGGGLIFPLLYSGLLTFDATLRSVPALADRYSVSADGLRYTFHLRSSARFSDGAPITSTDAAFSLDRAAGPCNSFVAFLYSALKDQPRYAQQACQFNPHAPPTISANNGRPTIPTLVGDALLTPDPGTLVVILSRPDGALLTKLAEPSAAIIERSVVLRYGGDWTAHLADHGGQGTSGMYRLSLAPSIGADGVTITLERSTTYWGPHPHLREIVVDLRSPQAFPTGDVIFAGDTRGDSQQATATRQYIQQVMRTQPGFHETPTRSEEYLLLDSAASGLRDVRVRQALALALDKPALAALLSGVATNHLVPPGAGDYSTALSGPIASAPLTGDVTQARALWQSYVHDRCGGIASHCPTVTLWLTAEDLSGVDLFQQSLEQAITRQWQAALPGLRVQIVPHFLGPLLSLLNASYTSDLIWSEDYPDPQNWLSTFTAPSPVHVSASDALIQRAEETLDPLTRLALYHQAEMTLLNDAVVIPLAQQQVAWSVKPDVMSYPTRLGPQVVASAWAGIYLVSGAKK